MLANFFGVELKDCKRKVVDWCARPRQIVNLGIFSRAVTAKNRPLNSLYVLFSQYRSCDNTLENCFFQMWCYSRAFVHIIYKKDKGPSSSGTSIGKTKHTS